MKKHNILYLCSDQQHWQAQGSVDPFFDTPHQDALSADSTVFENAFLHHAAVFAESFVDADWVLSAPD